MPVERLYPRPGEIEATDAVSGLDLGSRAPEGRPYVVINMVASLDGKAAVDGTTRDLGGDTDREIFGTLRTQADAILAGSGTVREERYSRPARSAERQAQREREGLDPNPWLVIVSARLNVPADLPVLQDPEARVVIATGVEHEIDGDVQADVTYLRTGDDLPVLMARLREELGVRSVLCEGGPTVNAHLLAGGIGDELFQTIDPAIVGGSDGMTIVTGRPLREPVGAELIWLLKSADGLHYRWRLRT